VKPQTQIWRACFINNKQEPFRFLAVKGVEDLLAAAGAARVLPVVPQLVVPLKTALATRDPDVVRIALQLLQKLAACGGRVGEALVPYYRQLLPIMAAYVGRCVVCLAGLVAAFVFFVDGVVL
jgi:hypothetical protein